MQHLGQPSAQVLHRKPQLEASLLLRWPPACSSASALLTARCLPCRPAILLLADVLLNIKEPAGVMAAANLFVVLHVAAAWQVSAGRAAVVCRGCT